MSVYPHLCAPFSVGNLTLANRIVMPPLVVFKAGLDGTVTPEVLAHYRESAGPGMVVQEATVVSPEGRLAQRQIGAFEDRHVESLAAIAGIIHGAGAVAALQIHHAGSNTTTENTFGMQLVAPSAVANRAGELPRALAETEIERIISCFAAAARRAREAGFDAVEVHAAHGYLVSQFLSPITNHRADQWGGSLENRARFLRRVLGRIREENGSRLAAYCRLGAADAKPEGLSLEEGIQVARWLEADGVPLLHVSHGIGRGAKQDESLPWSDLMQLGIAVKRAVGIPVIGVGEIVDPGNAEALLADGLVDLVAVGRGMLADPRWARKSLDGRADEIIPCRHCRICQHFGHSEKCPARRQGGA
jgi:2,4-dienoyl-CoA reductase-like NADH-dependent reductase (Old Yellow Enzyme family)